MPTTSPPSPASRKGVDQIVEIIDVEKVLAEIITFYAHLRPRCWTKRSRPRCRDVGCSSSMTPARPATRCGERPRPAWPRGHRVPGRLCRPPAAQGAVRCGQEGDRRDHADDHTPRCRRWMVTPDLTSKVQQRSAHTSDLFITLNTPRAATSTRPWSRRWGAIASISKFQPDLLWTWPSSGMRQILGR